MMGWPPFGRWSVIRSPPPSASAPWKSISSPGLYESFATVMLKTTSTSEMTLMETGSGAGGSGSVLAPNGWTFHTPGAGLGIV